MTAAAIPPAALPSWRPMARSAAFTETLVTHANDMSMRDERTGLR